MNSDTTDDDNSTETDGKTSKQNISRRKFILNKFKFKVQRSAVTNVYDFSTTSDSSPVNFPGEQQSRPEESLMFAKSVSDTKLSKSGATAGGERDAGVEIEEKSAAVVHPALERSKSLDVIKAMPAYGELITDSPKTTSNANQVPARRRDHLYKVLVIGDLATGKTSIIKRYVHRFFSQNYRATIGVDFALKVLNWDENTIIRLQLWDIAGQERYGNMTRVYFKEAVGAFIVFDCTRTNTFESVKNWKTDLDSKVLLADGSKIPCVLLANKCDQPKEGIVNNTYQMDEYCRTEGFAAWFPTSAKDNINIDDAARVLIEKILEKESVLNINKDGDQFSIQEDKQGRERSGEKKCSC